MGTEADVEGNIGGGAWRGSQTTSNISHPLGVSKNGKEYPRGRGLKTRRLVAQQSITLVTIGKMLHTVDKPESVIAKKRRMRYHAIRQGHTAVHLELRYMRVGRDARRRGPGNRGSSVWAVVGDNAERRLQIG